MDQRTSKHRNVLKEKRNENVKFTIFKLSILFTKGLIKNLSRAKIIFDFFHNFHSPIVNFSFKKKKKTTTVQSPEYNERGKGRIYQKMLKRLKKYLSVFIPYHDRFPNTMRP